jgi:hypothetical protein
MVFHSGAPNSTISFQHVNCDSCPENIGSKTGDAPLLKIRFSNSRVLIVCGYLNRRETPTRISASEFDIFECGSDTSLLQVGGEEERRIELKDDTLDIQETLSLRSADDWALTSFPFRRWFFCADKGSLALHGPIMLFTPPRLSRTWLRKAMSHCDTLLAHLKPTIEHEEEFYLVVDLLFCGVISGDAGARVRFDKLGHMGVLDGAWAEYYFGTKDYIDIITQAKN